MHPGEAVRSHGRLCENSAESPDLSLHVVVTGIQSWSGTWGDRCRLYCTDVARLEAMAVLLLAWLFL
jgi:hypothetical protein